MHAAVYGSAPTYMRAMATPVAEQPGRSIFV